MAPFSWAILPGLAALWLARGASGALPDGRPNGNMFKPPGIPKVPLPEGPVVSRNGTELPPYNTTYFFDQLIDHKNPSLGTFKQRFWFTYEFYEPGGPIILTTPGEANAQGMSILDQGTVCPFTYNHPGYTAYLTNTTFNGLLAQQESGATIVLEHRFYGTSNPTPTLSVEGFKYHTIQHAIDDLDHFARTVHLPMPGGDQVTPDQAPWINIGGSYSGALVSWAMVNKPNLFFAGYSSSGVVQAITDFWRYFEPIRQNMPRNCSSDVQAVIAHVDKVFASKDNAAISALKANWGMEKVTHLDDVAGALRNNLWDWQSLQPTSGNNTAFRQFCDALEVKDGVSASAEGWGLKHAVEAWGAHWRNGYLKRLCGDNDAETCLGTYNATSEFYTDESVDNVWRSWNWFVCNEVGYLQDGAPRGHPTLVTRQVGFPYDERQCQFMYPKKFKKPPIINVGPTNAKYKGWRVRKNRLFFANGVRDPWREATVSAQGIEVASTSQMPVAVSNGFHCTDLSVARGAADPTVRAVQQEALRSMNGWLKEEWEPKVGFGGAPERERARLYEDGVPPRSGAGDKPVNAWVKDFGDQV
ncbi:serine carboxypeptidase S28-domain-containing protein [Pterulicium gracile]|uniref:Serine carboxypeptidase S28-domain-containing protein n=1 Tax=Pterulicium gracile TaxID=1884261 RepID=A0A5C3QUL3_9AGAR|nr:serine carboxypeptidase S28-domain-containing protein [Pterula gracilis]